MMTPKKYSRYFNGTANTLRTMTEGNSNTKNR